MDLDNLLGLAKEYPFIEFGILLSKNNTGKCPRFPGQPWIDRSMTQKLSGKNLSMHLCGSWVRSICSGGSDISQDWVSAYIDMFDRIQLNFHGMPHHTYSSRFCNLLKSFNTPIIFQIDDVNNHLYNQAKSLGVNCFALHDLSGGAGILSDKWPKPSGSYCGYAGGLAPDNLKRQLDKLADVVGDTPIWIDAETHLRSGDGALFDIDKVIRFIEIAKPYVQESKL